MCTCMCFEYVDQLTSRKGPVKGSKDVGLSERSKPKFKRNPHKAKAKSTKEKVVAKERSGKGTGELEEAEAVRVGNKRRGHTARQEGAKGLKGVGNK